jgi:hypothetical protein
MMSASNIHFEMAERDRAINYGGIGAIHLMGQRLGTLRTAAGWLFFHVARSTRMDADMYASLAP